MSHRQEQQNSCPKRLTLCHWTLGILALALTVAGVAFRYGDALARGCDPVDATRKSKGPNGKSMSFQMDAKNVDAHGIISHMKRNHSVYMHLLGICASVFTRLAHSFCYPDLQTLDRACC